MSRLLFMGILYYREKQLTHLETSRLKLILLTPSREHIYSTCTIWYYKSTHPYLESRLISKIDLHNFISNDQKHSSIKNLVNSSYVSGGLACLLINNLLYHLLV